MNDLLNNSLVIRPLWVEDIDTMSKDTNNYIGDIVGIKNENILYFIFFQIKGHWESMVGSILGDVGKAQKNLLRQWGCQKETS